ncbi:MAG: 1-acyl-sn-glycerol-3-phosphate acyltransferase [Ruminococcus flavefaciens]|nr:1-acyl-sn-glycerol-3-phosphate acyltransferase [Ruminococcus flavefaciens]MCM1229008.1 1-acyl-sn-glycerol-3-phosphate acyltransferase [Ruminococcus flavefaciens]
MYYLIKVIVFIAFKIAFSVRYEGRKNIPNGEPVIYASSHRTNADPPLIACRAKGKFAFMAKEELFKNKFFAWLIRSLGAFPVARGKGDTGVLDTAIEALRNGRSLIIFPEGTRSKDGKVHRGHSGAAVISAKSQKKIIPVGIVFGEKLKFRTKITVKYGEPIDPSEYIDQPSDPNPRQLVKLKNRYMADIKQLVEGEPDSTANKNGE